MSQSSKKPTQTACSLSSKKKDNLIWKEKPAVNLPFPFRLSRLKQYCVLALPCWLLNWATNSNYVSWAKSDLRIFYYLKVSEIFSGTWSRFQPKRREKPIHRFGLKEQCEGYLGGSLVKCQTLDLRVVRSSFGSGSRALLSLCPSHCSLSLSLPKINKINLKQI